MNRVRSILILALVFPVSAQAQVMKLAGTSNSAFSLAASSAQPCVLNSSAGALTLAGGLTVSGGNVTLSGTTLGAFTTSGQITSTLATGTAPMSIASTTVVTNLNADLVRGFALTAAADGGVLYRSSATAIAESAAGTSGQFLKSGGTGAPTWAGLTSAYIFVGNASNIPTGVAMSGDATISNAGTLTIASSAVTAAKLADAVADAIPTASLTAGAEAADVIAVTLQVKDVQGNNLSAVYLVRWNISDSSYGASVTAQSPSVAYANGAEWNQIVASKKAEAFTDSTGKLLLNVTLSGAHTIYLMAAVGGKVYVVTLAFA